MKNSHRLTALFLSLLLASLTACGEAAGSADTTASSADTTAPAETEPSRENTPDNLPALDFGGRKIRFGQQGIMDSELNAEETGDIVDDAHFRRNIQVQERLNVEFELVPTSETDSKKFLNNVKSTILAGDDSYDIIISNHCWMAPLEVGGCFTNVADAPYLDFDQPWWAEEFMRISSLHEDTRYILAGDVLENTIASMSAVFFNRRMFEDHYGNPDSLYDIVLDGKWTMDKMREYISGAYQDLNADGKADLGDILGLGSTASSPTEHFAFPMGMKFIERDSDGYPTLVKDQSRNVEITDKLYQLFYETEGVMVASDANMINNEFPVKFAEGTMLFHADRISSADAFRDAKDPYGVIPRPKLDESQKDYGALVHDSHQVYAIPITVADIEAPCAVLEAMAAEGYRKVIPAYYEVTLKVKYAHDDLSSQMLDLIHQNATTDWIYANNYALASGGSLGTVQRKLMSAKSRDFMSTYATLSAQVEASLKTLIDEDKAK